LFKLVNRVYLLALISFYSLFSFKIEGEYFLVIFFAIFSFVSYFLILQSQGLISSEFYKNSNKLAIKVFLYLFVFIFMENFISYYYRDNFFLFNESDSITYHDNVLGIINMPFLKGISYYLSFMGFDDLGIILILYPLYHIAKSNLILNLFYLIVGVITANSIFSISQNFMTKKYAFLASLSYSISSFVVYFHGTGLKESFMVMLIVVAFDFYYRFLKKGDVIYLIVSILFISSIMLFRPILVGIIIGSMGLGSMLSKDGSFWTKLFSIFIFIVFVAMGGALTEQINSYTTGGVDTLISARETQGGVIGGIFFTYTVNILSQVIGPLPTIISMSKVGTMFYTSGLVYRVLLAFPFWFGVVHIYKTKSEKLYPLIIFTLMEMAALAYLIDGLELRKSLPHMPFVFIIAFWFLDKYDNRVIKFKKDKSFKNFFWSVMITLVLMIIYWNFR